MKKFNPDILAAEAQRLDKKAEVGRWAGLGVTFGLIAGVILPLPLLLFASTERYYFAAMLYGAFYTVCIGYTVGTWYHRNLKIRAEKLRWKCEIWQKFFQ